MWLVKIEPDNQNNLLKPSAADTFQVRSVSTKRFWKKTGSVSPTVLGEIKVAIKAVIDAD